MKITSAAANGEDGWVVRLIQCDKRLTALLILACFVGSGLMVWYWLQPAPLARSVELGGWGGPGSLTKNVTDQMQKVASDWRPCPALLLMASGGLLGRVVFAGPMARRVSDAAGCTLVALSVVQFVESRLLDRLAMQRGNLNSEGLWLQATAFLGYALMPFAGIVAVFGALTAMARLSGVLHWDLALVSPSAWLGWAKNLKKAKSKAIADRDAARASTEVTTTGDKEAGDTAHWLSSSSLPEGREHGHLGICLSGGGIRSATFAMGALQSLQSQQPALGGTGDVCELTRARYLTAVSGGGYIAGALLLATPGNTGKNRESSDGHTSGVKDTLGYESVFGPGSKEFDHLRRHSSYIADGLREWISALSVLVRGALLSTFFLSLIAMVAGRWAGHFYYAFSRENDVLEPWSPLWGDVFIFVTIFVVAAAFYWMATASSWLHHHKDLRKRVADFSWMSWLAAALLVLLGAVVPIVAWISVRVVEFSGGQGQPGVVGGAAKGSVLGVAGVVITLLGLINRQRARVLRTVEEGKGKLERWFGDAGSQVVRWIPVLAGLGMVLAVYLIIFGYSTHVSATNAPNAYPTVRWGLPQWQAIFTNLELTIFLTLALTILYWLSDETAMGLHPFYRRRLASAFAVRRVWSEDDEEFQAVPYSYEDRTNLENFGKPANTSASPPWPQIILCASAHCSDPDETPPGRHVLPFTFSYDYVGGPEVTWCSPAYMRQGGSGKKLGHWFQADLTVEAAMAVSGAAFASASGSARVPANMIMALINARLGTWMANPAYFQNRRLQWWAARPPRIRRLSYLLREIFALHPKDFPLLFVTDGAHYETLGLLELLRHRCKEIYCFDASSDNETFAASLARAITLAYDELGISVDLHSPESADPHRSGGDDEPDELKHRIAKTPIITGTLTYPKLSADLPAETGVIVIGRSTLYDGMPWAIQRHAAAHKFFPNDATGDQWFDDSKFNAYTTLGRHVGELAIKAMRVERLKLPLGRGRPDTSKSRVTDSEPSGNGRTV